MGLYKKDGKITYYPYLVEVGQNEEVNKLIVQDIIAVQVAHYKLVYGLMIIGKLII